MVIRVEHGKSGNDGSLFADRRSAAENNVIEFARVELVAFAYRDQNLCGQIYRRYLV